MVNIKEGYLQTPIVFLLFLKKIYYFYLFGCAGY